MRRLIEKLRTLSPGAWLMMSAGVLLVLLSAQALRYVMAGTMAAELGKLSLMLAAPPDREGVEKPEHYKAIAEKGSLGKQKPQAAKPQLFGILGDFAFMGNSPQDAKPYAIGAQFPGGEKLVEIHLNSVVIEKDGKRETLNVFPALGETAPGGPGPRGPGGPPPPAVPSDPGKPPTAAPEVRVEIQALPGTPEMDMEAARRKMEEEMKQRLGEIEVSGRFPRGLESGVEREEER